MVVIFNSQNSHLLTLSLPTEEVFLVRFEPVTINRFIGGPLFRWSVPDKQRLLTLNYLLYSPTNAATQFL